MLCFESVADSQPHLLGPLFSLFSVFSCPFYPCGQRIFRPDSVRAIRFSPANWCVSNKFRMTDMYLREGKPRRRGSWSERILLIGLSCLVLYAYMRLEGRWDAPEQTPSTIGKGDSDRCAWQPLVRAQDAGSQTCPADSYVKGVGIAYEDGFRQSYPLQYRLYCCALVATE